MARLVEVQHVGAADLVHSSSQEIDQSGEPKQHQQPMVAPHPQGQSAPVDRAGRAGDRGANAARRRRAEQRREPEFPTRRSPRARRPATATASRPGEGAITARHIAQTARRSPIGRRGVQPGRSENRPWCRDSEHSADEREPPVEPQPPAERVGRYGGQRTGTGPRRAGPPNLQSRRRRSCAPARGRSASSAPDRDL